jgi:hypothetical protein
MESAVTLHSPGTGPFRAKGTTRYIGEWIMSVLAAALAACRQQAASQEALITLDCAT